MKIKVSYWLLCFLLFTEIASVCATETLAIGSWNIRNFGKTKTSAHLAIIAKTIAPMDVVGIQEIVVGADGDTQMARLHRQLEAITKEPWSFAISLPNTANNPQEKERFAYLWKVRKVQLCYPPSLDASLEAEWVREPFIATFLWKKTFFKLINVHMVPKAKNPESEIAYLKNFPKRWADTAFIVLGDFNTPPQHNVFLPLKKQGYKLALYDQKTTLRQTCIQGDCMANTLDNFLYHPKEFKAVKAEVVHFYTQLNNDMKAARRISDHAPIILYIR